jgi:hypothetical protein
MRKILGTLKSMKEKWFTRIWEKSWPEAKHVLNGIIKE